jgi:hypothetical protein
MRRRYSDGEMPRTNRRLHGRAQPAALVPSSPVASHERRGPKLEAGERAVLRSAERGEWATVARSPAAKDRYARDAKATLRRHRQS